jgi:hypothetical protein
MKSYIIPHKLKRGRQKRSSCEEQVVTSVDDGFDGG